MKQESSATQVAKDITKRIYDEMSTRLTEPLTRKDIESSCQEQLHKVVEDIARTDFCDVDHKSIQAKHQQDGSVVIDYKLTTLPTIQKTYGFSFDLAKNPILKYLSRCETCRTPSGKIKLRWFWKSGVVTDFTKVQQATPDAPDMHDPDQSSSYNQGKASVNSQSTSDVVLVDAIIQLDASENSFMFLRGISSDDCRITDSHGAVVLMNGELTNMPDTLFNALPNPATAADVLELVADINYRNNLSSNTNTGTDTAATTVDNEPTHEQEQPAVRRSGIVTVAACDPSIKQDMPRHDHSYVNGFAFTPIQLPAGISLRWNSNFDESSIDEALSSIDKELLTNLTQQFIHGPEQEATATATTAHAASSIIDLDARQRQASAKKHKHERNNTEIEKEEDSNNLSLVRLRRKLLSEHFDSNDTITGPDIKHKNNKKLTRKQRARELQRRVTEAVEYIDTFTEHSGVDTEACIRYRLERAHRQLKQEAQQRLQAGEEELPRQSARYYKAVFDELERQLEQCERFNVWADNTAALHKLQQQHQQHQQ